VESWWGAAGTLLLNGILGGWKTNGIWQFASGQPLGLRLSGGQSLPTYGAQRPNLLGPIEKGSGSNSDPVSQYFANPQVAVRPTNNGFRAGVFVPPTQSTPP
jgi:hypothetical protein